MKTSITPELAASILKKNTANRSPNESNVEFLAEEMRTGNFKYNGESIIIAEDGTLMDGQHRLLAVVLSNTTVEASLIRNVPIDSMPTIDTGRARTAGDVLSIQGVTSPIHKTTAVRAIMSHYNKKKSTRGGKTIRIANHAIVEFYEENRDNVDAMVDYCMHLYNVHTKFITGGYAAGYLYLFSLESRLAKPFIRELFTGVQESESNAAIMLRNRLINDKMSPTKMKATSKRELVMYAWLQFKRGESVGRLKTAPKKEFAFMDPLKNKPRLQPDDL